MLCQFYNFNIVIFYKLSKFFLKIQVYKKILSFPSKYVIPVQTGIQKNFLDSHFRGNDGSQECVITVQTGIHSRNRQCHSRANGNLSHKHSLDSRFRGNDGSQECVIPVQTGIQKKTLFSRIKP